jgi:hypothetical protein
MREFIGNQIHMSDRTAEEVDGGFSYVAQLLNTHAGLGWRSIVGGGIFPVVFSSIRTN